MKKLLLIVAMPALPDVSAMRELLLREPIVWERPGGIGEIGDQATSARRVVQMTAARSLVAGALAKARANDPAAWEDLRAVWNLARSIDPQPQMMEQTAAFAMARMINAVAWKMPLPAPAWLGEVQSRDHVRRMDLRRHDAAPQPRDRDSGTGPADAAHAARAAVSYFFTRLGFSPVVLRATAARMSALNAFASISSPSWMSIARRAFPSRLALKSLSGSFNEAPFGNVSFTADLYDSPVQMIPLCDQTGTPGFVGLTHFHSSTTSGSASWMSLRIRASASPRQSPRSTIFLSIRPDADWSSAGFFMLASVTSRSSTRRSTRCPANARGRRCRPRGRRGVRLAPLSPASTI